MDRFTFRAARPEEKNEIAALYESAKGRPFCTWDRDYPGMPEIEEDLTAGGLFVMTEQGRIVGVITVKCTNELDDLDCWTVSADAAEISRVLICPERQGEHLSHLLVERSLELLTDRRCPAVHLSVVDVNIPAQRLYAGLGFEKRGEGERYGLYFYFLEKIL